MEFKTDQQLNGHQQPSTELAATPKQQQTNLITKLDKNSDKKIYTNHEQQKQQPWTLLNESKKGIVGLQNLGNTCFMNSGLQCLSHIQELTKYFIFHKYETKINQTNPLGTRGNVCKAYANVLRNLWFGQQSRYRPREFKMVIEKFQPMYKGFKQHDAAEFITYLLDGLHQDLNQAEQKQVLENQNSSFAQQKWSKFLNRNRSIIVRLIYGQLRSTVKCLRCNQSITQFDPFCIWSVPLQSCKQLKISLIYIERHARIHQLQVNFHENWSMLDIGKLIKAEFKTKAKFLFYTLIQIQKKIAYKIIDETQKVSEIQSQYGQQIYVRSLDDNQQPQDIPIMFRISILQNPNSKKRIFPTTVYFFKDNITFKQLYYKMYFYFLEVYQFSGLDQSLSLFKLYARVLKDSRITYYEIQFNDKELFSFLKDFYKNSQQYVFEMCWVSEIQGVFNYLRNSKITSLQGNNSDGEKINLQKCFDLFQKPQIMGSDHSWHCPKCKLQVPAQKKTKIYKAPKVLIISLRRFKNTNNFEEKDSILVDFPIQGLNLSKYVMNKNLPNEQSQTASNKKDLLYDLFAISNHYGNLYSGHYTAYCKNPITSEWYQFNDSHVSKINKNQLVSPNAYILFYKRQE